MNTPNGQQEPYGPLSSQPGQQPPRPQAGQDTYAPEEDIPRPREDESGGPGRGGQAPGRDAGWAGGQRGNYGAYPGGGPQPGDGYDPGGGGRPSYLNGGPVGFADAVRGAIANILTFRGRASRSAFWWFALLQAVAYVIVSWISDRSTAAGVILDILIGLPLLVAGISLAVRRLHDSDKRGWWWWIGFVPVVGEIILLVFYLLPGTRGPNRFNVAR
jgi:uncharacterized membrane protein YhaH (DUF805 family)